MKDFQNENQGTNVKARCIALERGCGDLHERHLHQKQSYKQSCRSKGAKTKAFWNSDLEAM